MAPETDVTYTSKMLSAVLGSCWGPCCTRTQQRVTHLLGAECLQRLSYPIPCGAGSVNPK